MRYKWDHSKTLVGRTAASQSIFLTHNLTSFGRSSMVKFPLRYFATPTLSVQKCKMWQSHKSSGLPSCSSARHKSPCCGHSWDPPAGCRTQRAAWSSLADAGTGSGDTAGWVPSPAGANIQGSQHPTGPGAGVEITAETWEILIIFNKMFTCKISAVLSELCNAICAIFIGAILDLEDVFCKDVKCESNIVLSYIMTLYIKFWLIYKYWCRGVNNPSCPQATHCCCYSHVAKNGWDQV